jgi:hypothetical protein
LYSDAKREEEEESMGDRGIFFRDGPTCRRFPWAIRFRMKLNQHLLDKEVVDNGGNGDGKARIRTVVISRAELTRAWIHCLRPHLVDQRPVLDLP